MLTDRGLEAALRGLAGRSPVPVELVGTPPQRLPAPVESAVYFVVAEALTNAARYAAAKSVKVGVWRDDGQVEVEVSDDGVGGADPESGSGLRGLNDRVSALDGRARAGQLRRRGHGGARENPVRVIVADDSVLLREGLAGYWTSRASRWWRRPATARS